MRRKRRCGRYHRSNSNKHVSANGLASRGFYQHFTLKNVLRRFRCAKGDAFLRKFNSLSTCSFINHGRSNGRFPTLTSITKGAFSHRYENIRNNGFIRRHSIRKSTLSNFCFSNFTCLRALKDFSGHATISSSHYHFKACIRRNTSIALNFICNFILGRLSRKMRRRSNGTFKVFTCVRNTRNNSKRGNRFTRRILLRSTFPNFPRRQRTCKRVNGRMPCGECVLSLRRNNIDDVRSRASRGW